MVVMLSPFMGTVILPAMGVIMHPVVGMIMYTVMGVRLFFLRIYRFTRFIHQITPFYILAGSPVFIISLTSLLYRNRQITEDRREPMGAASPIG